MNPAITINTEHREYWADCPICQKPMIIGLVGEDDPETLEIGTCIFCAGLLPNRAGRRAAKRRI